MFSVIVAGTTVVLWFPSYAEEGACDNCKRLQIVAHHCKYQFNPFDLLGLTFLWNRVEERPAAKLAMDDRRVFLS